MNLPRPLKIVLLIGAVIGFLFLISYIELPSDSFLWRELQNTGHTPFFGVLSLIILALSALILGKRIKHPWGHYIISFCAASFISALIEYLQIVGPRDADIADFMRNIAGIFSFLGTASVVDGRLSEFWKASRQKYRYILLVFSMAIFILSLVPLASWSVSYFQRNKAFPVICGFDSGWEASFARPEGAKLDITVPPRKWGKPANDLVGKLTFKKTTYPGLVIEEPYPNWGDYEYFSFSVYSQLSAPVAIGLRVDDAHYNERDDDRFNGPLEVNPGPNEFIIKLDEIRSGPMFRDLDLESVAVVIIYSSRPEEEFVLFIDNILLSRE